MFSGVPKALQKDGVEKKRRKKKKKDSTDEIQAGYRRNEKGLIILDEAEDVCSALKCLRPHGECCLRFRFGTFNKCDLIFFFVRCIK